MGAGYFRQQRKAVAGQWRTAWRGSEGSAGRRPAMGSGSSCTAVWLGSGGSVEHRTVAAAASGAAAAAVARVVAVVAAVAVAVALTAVDVDLAGVVAAPSRFEACAEDMAVPSAAVVAAAGPGKGQAVGLGAVVTPDAEPAEAAGGTAG